MRNIEPILHERVIHVTCYKGNIKNHKDFRITAPAPSHLEVLQKASKPFHTFS